VLRWLLLLQMDAIQREDGKQHAHSAWTKANAAALGVDVSDDDGDEGLADLQHSAVAAAIAGRASSSKKRRTAVLAAAAAAADSQAQAQQVQAAGRLAGQLALLQRQLTAALAVPLQPSISHKFFTGGMSRAAAAAAAAAAARGLHQRRREGRQLSSSSSRWQRRP